MSSNKKYWKSVEELDDNNSMVEALKQNEFVEPIPTDEFLGDKDKLSNTNTSRRDFLKYVGFSTAAASLAACEGPVYKSVPYVVQPERIIPGVADYYATTIADGFDFASVLVKTREARPIKIESNDLAQVGGGANARVHASVLSMYDTKRAQGPKGMGEDISWKQLDTEVANKLQAASGKQVVVLSQTFASPSTDQIISDFLAQFPNGKHVVYDTIDESAALDAFEAKFGVRALPDYDFAKAEVIVSVGADFLADWQGGGFSKGYAERRVPKNGKMSRHVQFEANMSMTGANADKRVPVTPSQQRQVLEGLHQVMMSGGNPSGLPENVSLAVQQAAAQLRKAGSKGIVVTGLQDMRSQSLALSINERLNSAAMDTSAPRLTRQGKAADVMQLVEDMNAGRVGALLIAGVNPAYSLPNAEAFKAGLEKVDVSVSFSMKEDETATLTNYLATVPHYLEAWGDVQLKQGHLSFMQPTIRTIFDTRQLQDTLLKWTGNDTSYQDYLKERISSAGINWNKALQDGVVKSDAFLPAGRQGASPSSTDQNSVTPAAAMTAAVQENTGGYELTLYTKVSMGDGQQANNPWLQEMPDPITRCSWDNYLTMSKADADALGIENKNVANGGLDGAYAKVTLDDVTVTVPVLIQPGQAKGSVGLALGYGKREGLQEEMQVGANAFPLYKGLKAVQNVTIENAGGNHEFACVQLQNTLMGRGDIIKETTLEIFNTRDKDYYNEIPHVSKDHQEIPVTSPDADLWTEFDRSIGHHFNLSIDLNSCTGCGACVIACHAENNVPVVGKDEIRKSRDMHWLRIDRYYSSDMTEERAEEEGYSGVGLFGDGVTDMFSEMEEPSAVSPQVVFQPVMCQHCNHAPCETVCPVAASAHGRQGQNHMTYNRCVGTRYCANNCPYKVRRFNWFLYNQNDEFDYHMNNDLGRMVLNPDVTVRSRGVMEKCSMCIQMTQKTILDAKREGRPIKDGEFATACSNACPTGAIQFGDINDKESKIAELRDADRSYHLLESVGTKPNVVYQMVVRNTEEA
ncbi:TAT-variant-translocated molybdopterin oxidoreductase [Croceiramulus getboli]|nr:TAT-variant-translocated molybdopterin oxidoreductase [Flavobacteriaceae bacterium YJPT1-3]